MTMLSKAIDKHIGKRVRMTRLFRGMTEARLARALEITEPRLRRLEQGSDRIRATELLALSKILGVSAQFFFQGRRRSPVSSAINDNNEAPHSAGGESELAPTLRQ